MSIAEKTLLLKDDIDKIYEAGYNKAEKQNYLYYAYTCDSLFYKAVFPENSDIVIRFKKAPTGYNLFMGSTQNTKTVTLISEDNSNNIKFDQSFRSNTSIEILDLTEFNCSFSSINYCFLGASNIREIKGELDFSNCTGASQWTGGASNLQELRIKPNSIQIEISVTQATKLSHDSLMSILNGLAVIETTKTLWLGTTNLNKLTDEEKAIATEKGWSLA